MSNFAWCIGVGGGGGDMPVADSECKFETTSIIGNYSYTNLFFDMLCKPISSDNEEKEV